MRQQNRQQLRLVSAFRLLLGVWAVALLLACRTTCGQMAPLVPDPITTPQLAQYAEFLNLSDQQQLSALSIHDDYRQRYRRFQDTDVERLIDEAYAVMSQLSPGQFIIPERRALDRLLEQYKRTLDRARAVDRTLFDALSAMLTEEQLVQLERVRAARETSIYRQIIADPAGEMNDGVRVDLSEMLRQLDRSPQDREQSEPMLMEYERSLLTRTRDLYAEGMKAITAVLNTIDELGLRQMTPEQLMRLGGDEQFITNVQQRFDELSKPFQKAAFEISQLNLRTFRRLRSVLDEKTAGELRDRYYRRGYGEVYRGPAPWRGRYAEALRLPGLADRQAAAIRTQRRDFAEREDRLIDDMAMKLEADREYRTFARFAEMEPNPLETELADYRQRRQGLGEDAVAALDGLLGPELLAQLDGEDPASERKVSEQQHTTTGAAAGAGGEGAAQAPTTTPEAPPAPQWLEENPLRPTPLPHADLRLITDQLGWGDAERAILAALYDEYRQQYEQVGSEPPPTDMPDKEDPTPTERGRAFRAVFDRLGEVDDGFFDDVRHLAADDAQRRILDRHRALRRREAHAEVTVETVRMFGDEEASIDLIRVMMEHAPDSLTPPAVDASLHEYELAVGVLVVQRLDRAQEAYRRALAIGMLRRRAGRQPGAVEFASEKWRDARNAVHDVNREIIQLNRRLLGDITHQLPEGAAWELRYDYNRTAFPDIFNDPRSAEKVLTAARGMPDLTPRQRQQLDEIADAFRTEYFRLSQRLVELRRQRDAGSPPMGIPSRDIIDREIELERLRIERDEVSARAKLRLRLVLTDEQLQRIPDLVR